MRIDFARIYFGAILGALGGLCAWLLVALVGNLALQNVYMRDAVLGLGVGVAIGGAVGSTDGLIVSRSLRRWLHGFAYGAVLGAIGGVFGLVLGELIFGLTGGGVWPRAVGWSLFGGFVGTSDGFASRMPAKVRYGVLGGLMGGLIGGSTYERLTVLLLSVSGNRAFSIAWGGAIGLILLGACIGALISLVESVLRKVWVTILNGRLEGQNRTIDPNRNVTTIGRSDAASIVLLGDIGVGAIHAEIIPQNGQFLLRPRDGTVTVERHGKVEANGACTLHSGDRIRMANTRLIFQAEEVTKR